LFASISAKLISLSGDPKFVMMLNLIAIRIKVQSSLKSQEHHAKINEMKYNFTSQKQSCSWERSSFRFGQTLVYTQTQIIVFCFS
jgi:uncharacterized protein YcgL (UPF0745 family)